MSSWFQHKKLLVPFDFSDESAQAIDTALEMAWKPSNVAVVHVAPDMNAASPEIVWETLPYETRKSNLEDAFHQQFSDEKYQEVRFDVTFGDPGQEIAEHAKVLGADVIVMPSHGLTGIKRLLIGSVAERVGRMAHCPVILLRS